MSSAGDTSAPQKQQVRDKLFIRVHPSAFLQLWNVFLQVCKKQNPPVTLQDLRFDIGSIDITGPGSTEALLATMRPFKMNEPEEKSTVNGVFVLLSECYSPTCTRDQLCYSIACPRRLEQVSRLNLKITSGLRKEDSANVNDDEVSPYTCVSTRARRNRLTMYHGALNSS